MNNQVNKKNKISNCTDINQLFADHLTGDLSNLKTTELNNHLITCSSCSQEFEDLTQTWTKLGILPEKLPSENLRKNFYTMLDSFQEGNKKKMFDFGDFIKNLWPKRPVYQFAFSLLFLIIGFYGGYKITFDKVDMGKIEVRKLESQSDQLKHQLSLTLLEQSSPSQRLKGLTWISTVQSPNEKLINSILKILNTDSNVNVRLSAVEALYLFSDFAQVKTGLVNSLQKQSSPLVQVALIDLLVELREKRGIAALKELMKKQKLNSDVKDMAQNGLKQLL